MLCPTKSPSGLPYLIMFRRSHFKSLWGYGSNLLSITRCCTHKLYDTDHRALRPTAFLIRPTTRWGLFGACKIFGISFARGILNWWTGWYIQLFVQTHVRSSRSVRRILLHQLNDLKLTLLFDVMQNLWIHHRMGFRAVLCSSVAHLIFPLSSTPAPLITYL